MSTILKRHRPFALLAVILATVLSLALVMAAHSAQKRHGAKRHKARAHATAPASPPTPAVTSLKGAQILVFSKTAGYRHASIEKGQATLQALAKQDGFSVTLSEDPALFRDEVLKTYDAVVFLNTTGDVLDPAQQAAFERYIQSGGGLLGLHSATDTEHDGNWPWFIKLIGANFKSHPAQAEARLVVADPQDKALAADPALIKAGGFRLMDEWYNFENVNPNIHRILDIDGASYKDAAATTINPMVWSNLFDGGRAYYIGLGHREEDYDLAAMRRLMIEGLTFAAGPRARDYGRIRPEPGRLVSEAVTTDMNEPVAFDFLPDRNVLIVQRGGDIIKVDTTWGTRKVLGVVATDQSNAEHGAFSIVVDPGFVTNRIIYVQFSKRGAAGKMQNRVGRFRIEAGTERLVPLDTLIDIPIEDNCCHTGNGLAFNARGELFITTGDNTNPWNKEVNGFAPIDNRPDAMETDALRSSGNTDDLRGKVLRIVPKAAGGYTIPKGNLFSDPRAGRPEIYAMGFRNPYSLAIDPVTGYLYIGDVGPDSSVDDATRGPRGQDEIDEVKSPGNYGWPLFIGNNMPYLAHDYVTGREGAAFDPARPVNASPRNTGARVLPAARPALVWYPYNQSTDFPELGTGGRSAVAGGIYHRPKAATADNLPAWYDGKLFISDFVRSYIKVVDFDGQGHVRQISDLSSNIAIDDPIDMMFGPDGHLYVLAYGPKWNAPNPTSGLYRIVFRPGEQPKAVAAAPAVAASPALALMDANTCLSCHQLKEDSVGPAYTKVAAKYKGRTDAVAYVAGRIAAGSQGVWGSEHAMPAFDALSAEDRKTLAAFIMEQ